MITMTAKDIIRQAKFISNTTNSTLTDFYINTMLLSSLYRDLYTQLTDSDSAYIVNTTTTATEYPLRGIYKVAAVYTEGGVEITRSNLRNRSTGGYYVENDTLYLPSGTKHIKLIPLPTTITVPDDYKEITLSSVPADYSNPSVDETGKIGAAEPFFYHGETIDPSNPPDWMERDDASIVNINVSDPYAYVSYDDGSIRLYSSEDDYTDVNPWINKGKRFSGKVIAFTSDDSTGKGMIFYDALRGKYYYGSFVPDTVLNYPDNTFFQLLIYKLGAILASLVGLENPYLLNTLIPEAEMRFTQSLSKGSQGSRFANVLAGGRYR